MRERLQKILARAGVASRRHAESLIASGAVTVNGAVARLGQSAELGSDDIRVHGRKISVLAAHTYLALNKPPGVVSSRRSTHGEATVLQLLPPASRVFPVGRLDKDTSGLLLLTDDGDWANLVTHPRYGVEKEYRALVQGKPGDAELQHLRRGVRLPDGSVTAPARVERIGDDRGDTLLGITVVEGKKRQIRLMAAAVGHQVIDLQRVRIGPLSLGTLPVGEWRALTQQEVRKVQDVARRLTAPDGAQRPSPRQH
jgi:pseudouridine synthase